MSQLVRGNDARTGVLQLIPPHRRLLWTAGSAGDVRNTGDTAGVIDIRQTIPVTPVPCHDPGRVELCEHILPSRAIREKVL
jgi:hypothetical protein